MDIQKQIGVISRETGEQTKKLDALNDKVAIQNGRVTKNEVAIALIKDTENIKRGKMIVIGTIAGGIAGIVLSLIASILAPFIRAKMGI